MNECINILARGIGRPGVTSSGGTRAFLFVINPSLAQAFADAGYSREKLRGALAERAFKYSYDWQNDSKQGNAVPVADPVVERARKRIVVQGEVPSALKPPSGCRFHTRCPMVMDRCKSEDPLLADLGQGRSVACHLHSSV